MNKTRTAEYRVDLSSIDGRVYGKSNWQIGAFIGFSEEYRFVIIENNYGEVLRVSSDSEYFHFKVDLI